MTETHTIEAPRIFPTMRCTDAEAMILWLRETFGFAEHVIYRGAGGDIEHAQLALGSSILMLGQHRDDVYGKMIGDIGGRRTDALYVAVADPDALYKRAKAAGAKIEMEPHDTDYGSRQFVCRDPEGNLWSFGTYWPKAHEKPAA